MSKSVMIVYDSVGLRRVVSSGFVRSEGAKTLSLRQSPFAQLKRVMP